MNLKTADVNLKAVDIILNNISKFSPYPNRVKLIAVTKKFSAQTIINTCLLYTSPSPRDRTRSRMPSSA